MRFSFTPEQEEFRASLRRALEARSPTKEVRRLMATEAGFEREGWKRLNQEMGLTAVALIYSPMGGRSGAHMNPGVTLTFLRLGKISPGDAAGYIVAQFIGGAAGIAIAVLLLRGLRRTRQSASSPRHRARPAPGLPSAPSFSSRSC